MYHPTLKEIRKFGKGWGTNVCQPNGENEALGPLVDKHAVKEFVAQAAPSLKFAKEYAYVTKLEEITSNFMSQIPSTYMIKGTHLSGGVGMVDGNKTLCLKRCKNVKQEGVTPLDFARDFCSRLLKAKMGKTEKNYKRIKRGCSFEEVFDNIESGLQEYKIQVFHGRPMVACIYSNRIRNDKWSRHHTDRNLFTLDEELILPDNHYPRLDLDGKPKVLDAILLEAKRLYDAAQTVVSFEYVRIDFHVWNEEWAFAEYTFTHEACRKGMHSRKEGLSDVLDLFYGFVGKHPELNIAPNAIASVIKEYEEETLNPTETAAGDYEDARLKEELNAVSFISVLFGLLAVWRVRLRHLKRRKE